MSQQHVSDPPHTADLNRRVRETLDLCRSELLNQRNERGYWEGELAGSALSTATAISALSAVLMNQDDSQREQSDTQSLGDCVRRGIDYLREQQNEDGGFGDTDLSHSNIATSYLVLSASALASQACGVSLEDRQIDSLRRCITAAGELEGLKTRYGKDKTFVVPILSNMAIAGLADWNDVQRLPFEAAVFPQSMYRFLSLPVVSYAIPALVAIGQSRHFLGKRSWAPIRWMRSLCVRRTMNVLAKTQPNSGGYLEATPLTAFVVMNLAVTGRGNHQVAQNGIQFLKDSMRENGCWPIDTNLATWVTSLSIHALASDPTDDGEWCNDRLVRWHLNCQHAVRHPFTGAEPGGWGWTDLSGAVPDGDDTPAAILAQQQIRKRLDPERDTKQIVEIDRAIAHGRSWLQKLQNRDGGWPTFCRGWGKLPFDRSSTDLTAHTLRAMANQPSPHAKKGHYFLQKQQLPDGSWMPLWFGNQDAADESNPVYGTARVLLAELDDREATQRAVDFLIQCQNVDGGWGGGDSCKGKIESQFFGQANAPKCPQNLVSSVEETGLAVEALSTIVLRMRDFAACAGVSHVEAGKTAPFAGSESGDSPGDGGNNQLNAAIIRGIEFLLQSVDDRRHRVAWPIGFYFAKLWYHERLYPLIFTVGALGKYLRAVAEQHDPDWPK